MTWLTNGELRWRMDRDEEHTRRREALLRPWLRPSVLAHVDQVTDLAELRSLLTALYDERADTARDPVRMFQRTPAQEDRRDGELNMLRQVLALLPAETSDPLSIIGPTAPEQRSNPMTTVQYRGIPAGPAGDNTVLTVDDTGRLSSLRHIVRHSPTGFSWGYGGSGPADLARSLLVDALGDAAKCPSCAGSGRIMYLRGSEDPVPFDHDRYVAEGDTSGMGSCFDCDRDGIAALPYHDFKFEVIAHFPQGQAWNLPRAEVLAWVAARQKSTR